MYKERLVSQYQTEVRNCAIYYYQEARNSVIVWNRSRDNPCNKPVGGNATTVYYQTETDNCTKFPDIRWKLGLLTKETVKKCL